MDTVELVKSYLRAQNLEQMDRVEEAVELYEAAVAEGFDATGPYERLIAIYSHRARHNDVVRVADEALAHVRTYDDKRAWYERMRADAKRAADKVPTAVPKERDLPPE